mgnify:CR=1 FL=1
MSQNKSTVTLKGNKKDGYIIVITDKVGVYDIAITHNELEALHKILNKKLG